MHSIDLISGVMLHEFMRLELSFTGNTTTDLVKAILHDEPPAVPGHYSEDLKSICICLLEKNPARRLGFAGLLLEPLFYAKVCILTDDCDGSW
jgi:serine/threonine protein kinase